MQTFVRVRGVFVHVFCNDQFKNWQYEFVDEYPTLNATFILLFHHFGWCVAGDVAGCAQIKRRKSEKKIEK